MIAMENAIHVTDKARERVRALMIESGYDENHFLRVSVVGGGCSGLSYKMDFDKDLKPADAG